MDNLTINCLQKEKGKKNLKETRRCLELLLLLLKETTGSHSGVFDFVNRGFREKVNGPSGSNGWNQCRWARHTWQVPPGAQCRPAVGDDATTQGWSIAQEAGALWVGS